MADAPRYVLLNPGDVIQEGDEYFDGDDCRWMKCHNPDADTASDWKIPIRRADLSPLAAARQVPEVAAMIEAAQQAWDQACADHGKEAPFKFLAPYKGLVAIHTALAAIGGAK